jgi:hypothetical protein
VYRDVFVADKPLKRGLGSRLAGLCQRQGAVVTGEEEQHEEDAAARSGPDMDAAAAAGATFTAPGEVTSCVSQLLDTGSCCWCCACRPSKQSVHTMLPLTSVLYHEVTMPQALDVDALDTLAHAGCWLAVVDDFKASVAAATAAAAASHPGVSGRFVHSQLHAVMGPSGW